MIGSQDKIATAEVTNQKFGYFVSFGATSEYFRKVFENHILHILKNNNFKDEILFEVIELKLRIPKVQWVRARAIILVEYEF